MREGIQLRTRTERMAATSDDSGKKKYIEGYFIVFDELYEFAPDCYEMFDNTSADDTLSDDVRALINHDTTLVLGRTKANTLTLEKRERGIWGRIEINENDHDAMSLYARVQRGDVDQCSCGFEIIDEVVETHDAKRVWVIKKIKLYEISCCTFPAYETTGISARSKSEAVEKLRQYRSFKERMEERIKKWH